MPLTSGSCPLSCIFCISKNVPERAYSDKTVGSKPMVHLRVRRFISLAGNLLKSFLITNRFTSGIKLVQGRVTRRDIYESQASGSHHRLQHWLRQTVHRNTGS